jgi:hypothetical protein
VKAALRLVLALAALLTLAACQTGRKTTTPPRAQASAGSVGVSQTGDAATPATATENVTRTETTIPPGSLVTVHPDGSVTWTNAAPVALVSTHSQASATGPAAFTPPAPPTPAEEARGRVTLWLWLGLVAGAASGAFGLVRGWDVLAVGGGVIAAACVLGLALAACPPWLLFVLGLGVAACVIGPVLWHTKLKPRAPAAPAAPA